MNDLFRQQCGKMSAVQQYEKALSTGDSFSLLPFLGSF